MIVPSSAVDTINLGGLSGIAALSQTVQAGTGEKRAPEISNIESDIQ